MWIVDRGNFYLFTILNFNLFALLYIHIHTHCSMNPFRSIKLLKFHAFFVKLPHSNWFWFYIFFSSLYFYELLIIYICWFTFGSLNSFAHFFPSKMMIFVLEWPFLWLRQFKIYKYFINIYLISLMIYFILNIA